MKKRTLTEWVIDIISALFVLLFAYTALSKTHEHKHFQFVLKKSPLIGDIAELVSYLLPAIEIIIVFALVIPKTKFAGLWASFLLMGAFTIYIAYMIAYAPSLPCSCGGVLTQLTWRQHLVFNIAFTVFALIAIVLFVTNNKEKIKLKVNK